MAAVLEGIRVLDLSWGIAGPMTAMLLADQGASVTKIEPPGGDPFRSQLGYRVWQRGKRSAVLDLKNPQELEELLTLARQADILIESFSPGVTTRLGIDYPTLQAANPRLIYCSITGYGRDNKHAARPAYDALVAARIGLHFEQRGWPEGALNHLAGKPDPYADIEMPFEWLQGAPRPGPLFPASHWPSLGAFFTASTAVSAALRAREVTGNGQWVETSLFQGALACAVGVWQRAEKLDVPMFDSWILGSRSPKGHFQCADGHWIHNWVVNPRFILTASAGEQLNATPDLKAQKDPDRFGTGPEELLVMSHYQPILAEAVRKFTAAGWVAAAAQAGMTMQEVRSPEAALSDPLLLADGCVAEVQDPELGVIRQVGRTYRLFGNPSNIGAPPARPGEHTAEVKAEAAALNARSSPSARPSDAPAGAESGAAAGAESGVAASAESPAAAGVAAGRKLSPPLEGITVLDLGLAIAGPFGTQVLSDLGANVIKINALYDTYWHSNHIAYVANRGKRSIALDLKDPRAMRVLHELVARADVVQHNMRYDAAQRLGVDYESLKKINTRLVYCHTRGHETGPRESLPGNDQTAACLAGVQYEDGGMARGGKPLWSFCSLGDTGNGFLSAIAIIQALYHRDRTGEGQFCDTSIINAQLLNTSYAVARPDGTGFERPRVDGMQLGVSALNRLYETQDGWLCLVIATGEHWDRLCVALGIESLAADPRFATASGRAKHDAELATLIGNELRRRTARDGFEALDRAGVPCEICDDQFSLKLHDDPDLKKRGWVVSYTHPFVGKLDQIGLLFDLSATPGRVQGPPLIVGQHSRELLAELGYSPDQIEDLCKGPVMPWSLAEGHRTFKSRWQPAATQSKPE